MHRHSSTYRQTTRFAPVAASVALLCLICAAAHAAAPKIDLTQWQLANGLRIVFSPQGQVPGVTVQLWYHVGSKNERPGIRGVAHLFEHMMFKGSRHVRPEAHAKMISAVGGSTNAFTTQDLTAYHNTVPAPYLEFAIELEAERMRHLLLTEGTIASEREVVKEEKRLRQENSPIGRVLEAIHALSYKKHPYAWTPAGTIADLKRVTRQDCQAFYDRYYVPNNATLIVVGDVSETRVRAAADKHFGPIPRGAAPPRVEVVEPPQRAQREQLADWPSQLSVVLGAYHIPPAGHADIAALEVLSAILATGRSSRLHQALVRRAKVALQSGGFVWPREHPGLLFVYGVGLPVHRVAPIKKALLAEVARLVRDGVTAEELTKAKNQLTTRHLSQMRRLGGVARAIGSATYLQGDPRAFFVEIERMDRVTAARVKEVAERYLRPEQINLVLLPGGAGKAGGAK